MTHGQKALCRALVLTVGISFATAQSAQAQLKVAGNVNGVDGFCIADNNVGCVVGIQISDSDATVGRIRIAEVTVGGVVLSGTLTTTVGPPVNILNTSLTLRNPTAVPVTMTLAVGATSFTGPTTRMFTAGSGTWQTADGSEIQLSWYHDPANSQGAETALDRPGTELTTFDDSAKDDLLEAFATDSHHKSILDSPFSLTLGVDLTLVGGGTLLGVGQAVGTSSQ